ncbi:MAG TPA: TetR family transcriptional regulator [Stackebrandtia sp.]|uniref:TetR/AcrR family transcriptional regulator n=1 Tax=Stackebrandtia sp. TaxID=2023065 RepID=UPI002D44EBE7|nr:TetR family transcriptional regulator [Stackebrandtia sp.]HZE39478.1 TetR family transcriptional regulator [Stackebrandtia sp.]
MAPETSAERGRHVRERLLAAAAELIAERGWTAVSTRVLAERAGVRPGLVHYHFASLQDLLRQAAVAAMGRVVAETSPPSEGVDDPAAVLDALTSALDAYEGRDPTSLLFIETYLASTRDPELRELIAAMLNDFRHGVAEVLRGSGVAEPEATAVVLVAALDGYLLHKALDVSTSTAAVKTVLRRLVPTPSR